MSPHPDDAPERERDPAVDGGHDRDPERVEADVVVVGGGMTGTAAALSAARLGAETVLVNDRPVLGGNASSEVRVWVNGATGGANNRYAREGGVMEELLQRKKQEGLRAGADVWDAVLIDAVREQERLSLHLNTLVTDVETGADAGSETGPRVTGAVGYQHMSERSFRFEAGLFVDATGDAVVAAAAGADWVMGREAADAFGEVAAPETADGRTLGSSIMFSSREKDEPVDYEPPSFAREFREDPPEIVARRTDPDQRNECYWWIEYGGDEALDPIADNEAIRDELWAIVYGVWDYIKNSGAFPESSVANLDLEWVGKIPGKRESRRVRGAYVLTEDDVVSQRRFEDAVGHGGWSIDLHPPAGIYDDQGRGADQWHVDGPYSYPYRSLYARDLANVLVPGRHMSATHVAFGSLRVQMTLATVGQAAGTAAALCHRRGLRPAGLAEEGVEALQQALLREDQWIVGEPNRDPTDHAREATVTASSEQPAALTDLGTTVDLGDVEGTGDVGLHLACEDPVEAVELLLESDDGPTELTVEVYEESRPENTIPDQRRERVAVTVPEERSWVEVPVGLDVGDGEGLFLMLVEPAGVRAHARERELTGAMALPRQEASDHDYVTLPDRGDHWGVPGTHAMAPTGWVPCFRFRPEQPGYAAANVTDGYARPYGAARGWLSTPFETTDPGVAAEPEWIAFDWEEPRTLSAVQFACNTRLNDWFNVYGHGHTGARAEPEAVRDYRIEVAVGGGDDDGGQRTEWRTVARTSDSYRRLRRHRFEPVETDRLRIVVEATNGVPWAELFEVRAYGPDHDLPLGER
jgi:hypothetical protein